ncbi:MAG: class I SAM-dependent methyltransferase [Myxococcales bacterium]|nr:class I SAM-dependent methyltransferase [Myxococcales bacterium]
MFGNRLRKVWRHRRKWASREGITCLRLYDRDIPEVPLVVDRYHDRLYLAEFVRAGEPADDDWIQAMCAAAAEALGVAVDDVFVKRRDRQRGDAQYTRLARERAMFVVEEGGLRFQVNLSDYLDTGLFLDHRQTRAMVREASAGRRVLNLYAYTGSFTVYAADGGARGSTTVDLSHTYLDWAGRNLALNHLQGPQHEPVQADVMAWLAEQRPGQFDVVICDPPTFSNSKRMEGTLDVQRDHGELLRRVARVTAPGGQIWFSTNRRRFQLQASLPGLAVTEITDQTVPPDFEGKRPHRCWHLVKGSS